MSTRSAAQVQALRDKMLADLDGLVGVVEGIDHPDAPAVLARAKGLRARLRRAAMVDAIRAGRRG